jgi:hypothetical protein
MIGLIWAFIYPLVERVELRCPSSFKTERFEAHNWVSKLSLRGRA